MLQPDVNDKDQVQGSLSAPVVLVEYGDYQCPHCRHAHPHVQKIIKHFGNKVAFVFRNFPLTEMHPMAFAAALTAEGAAKQNLFWPVHDAIFNGQQKLENGIEGLLEIAGGTGLDESLVQQAWDDKILQQKVEDDFESGIMSGVNGTPSFFINKKKYTGMPEFSELKAAIDELLASTEK